MDTIFNPFKLIEANSAIQDGRFYYSEKLYNRESAQYGYPRHRRRRRRRYGGHCGKRLGKEVLLLAKGQVGNSGNTIMVGGSFAMDGESAYYKYGIQEADPNYTKEMVYESIVTDGFFLGDQPGYPPVCGGKPGNCVRSNPVGRACGLCV